MRAVEFQNVVSQYYFDLLGHIFQAMRTAHIFHEQVKNIMYVIITAIDYSCSQYSVQECSSTNVATLRTC